MTAILLAAGVGRRMGPGAGPKCLLNVGGKSLLRRTLESLRAVGVSEAVLVTGFQAEAVEREARAHAGPMRLTVLTNPRYREGAVLSLWTARGFLDRDALVMDADVLCPQAAFERLAGSPHRNCLLVDGSVEETGEEQMVFGREGRALHIAKQAPQEIRNRMEKAGESLGFLRLNAGASGILRRLLEQAVEAGQVGIEHEQVYPGLFERVQVGCERVDGLAWTEIDTPEDLARAEQAADRGGAAAQCVNRLISGWFLPAVLRTPLTPNQWTFVSLGLGLASLPLMADGSRSGEWLGALLFQLFYLADNWDGEVARCKGLSSRWGGWLDLAVDGVVQIPLPLALAAGLRRAGGPGCFPLAWAAAAGIALAFGITGWAKRRGFGPAIPGDPSRAGAGAKPGLARWLRVNWTNENFSWVVALALLLGWRLPLLAAMAVGAHLFWLRFLWKERRRFRPMLK